MYAENGWFLPISTSYLRLLCGFWTTMVCNNEPLHDKSETSNLLIFSRETLEDICKEAGWLDVQRVFDRITYNREKKLVNGNVCRKTFECHIVHFKESIQFIVLFSSYFEWRTCSWPWFRWRSWKHTEWDHLKDWRGISWAFFSMHQNDSITFGSMFFTNRGIAFVWNIIPWYSCYPTLFLLVITRQTENFNFMFFIVISFTEGNTTLSTHIDTNNKH